MILCIDSGNSRIKYGLWAGDRDGGAWLLQAALGHAEVGQLAAVAAAYRPTRIVVANVAGPGVAAALRAALADWLDVVEFVASTPAACGVGNGYRQAARLGVDRWCALIGARHQCPGALLVVMAGTATTIDSLDAAGNFLGGLILPGQQLMLSALARDTAALPFADGQHADFPRCTEDAIVSGAIEAQVGAIERAWLRLPVPPGGAQHCLLSGGNAPLLLPQLAIPVRPVDNLPLLGLKEMALDPAGWPRRNGCP